MRCSGHACTLRDTGRAALGLLGESVLGAVALGGLLAPAGAGNAWFDLDNRLAADRVAGQVTGRVAGQVTGRVAGQVNLQRWWYGYWIALGVVAFGSVVTFVAAGP